MSLGGGRVEMADESCASCLKEASQVTVLTGQLVRAPHTENCIY